MTNKGIFHELNQTRQHNTRGQQLDLFQSTPILNTTDEYWFFSDLHNLFGDIFPINQAMEKTAHEKIIYPYDPNPTNQQKFDFCTGHYDTLQHAYKLDYREFKHANDLQLTRYACWSFLYNRPEAIFAQTYFMTPVLNPNMSFDAMNTIASEYKRINLREQLSKEEKKLAGILSHIHANYKDFYNLTSLVLFNGLTYNDIKEIHHIPNKPNETLLDYMGKHTLRARVAALSRTIIRYNISSDKTLQNLKNILCDELYNERADMINSTGRRPEQDISIQHIDKVKKHLKETQQAFIKKYSIQKIR